MTTFEKTWQHGWNYPIDSANTTNTVKNAFWWQKAFLTGQLPIRKFTKGASGDNKAHPEVAGTTQDNFLQGLWYVLATSDGGSTSGCTTITSGSNNATLPQSTINVTSTANFANGSTTIAAGSNGQSLPQATINVASTTSPFTFPTQGTLQVTTGAGVQTVAYTGTTGTTFTGCTGGTGAMSTGGAVTILGTIYVGTSLGIQPVNYTGTSGGNQFTGCTGGTGTLATSNGVYDCLDRTNGAGGLGTTTLQLGTNAGSTNSGTAASFTTGATIAGAVRVSGVANMGANDIGNFICIAGATTPGNNSPVSSVAPTPFKIVNVVNSTTIDIFNPFGSTTDTNNGAIAWQERNAYNLPGSSAGNYSTIVGAANGANHTWMLMMSPLALGPYFYTLDYNSATTTNASNSFSKTATNVASGGSSTNVPTFSDTTSFQSYQYIVSGIAGGYMNGTLSTDGYFMQFTTRGNGSGYMEWGSLFQVVANAKTADSYPFVYFNRFGSGNTFGAGFYNVTGQWFSRNFNGTALVNPLPLFCSPSGGSAAVLSFNAGFSASNGDMPFPDMADGLYDDFPVYMFVNNAGQSSIKGRLVDIRESPWLIEGFTEPNPSSPQSVFLGGLWWPCNLPPIT